MRTTFTGGRSAPGRDCRMVIASPFGHQETVGVVKEEQPVQIVLRKRTVIPSKTCSILIAQELNRHEQPRSDTRANARSPQSIERH